MNHSVKFRFVLTGLLLFAYSVESTAEHENPDAIRDTVRTNTEEIACHPITSPCKANTYCKFKDRKGTCKSNRELYKKAIDLLVKESVLKTDDIKEARISEQTYIWADGRFDPPTLTPSHSNYRVWFKLKGEKEVMVNLSLDGEIGGGDNKPPFSGVVPKEKRKTFPWGDARFYAPKMVSLYFGEEMGETQAKAKLKRLFKSSPILKGAPFEVSEVTVIKPRTAEDKGGTAVYITVPYFSEIQTALELEKAEARLKPDKKTNLTESWINRVHEIEFPQYIDFPDLKIGQFDKDGKEMEIEKIERAWELPKGSTLKVEF